jgi:hypothetical protein
MHSPLRHPAVLFWVMSLVIAAFGVVCLLMASGLTNPAHQVTEAPVPQSQAIDELRMLRGAVANGPTTDVHHWHEQVRDRLDSQGLVQATQGSDVLQRLTAQAKALMDSTADARSAGMHRMRSLLGELERTVLSR